MVKSGSWSAQTSADQAELSPGVALTAPGPKPGPTTGLPVIAAVAGSLKPPALPTAGPGPIFASMSPAPVFAAQ